MATLYWSTPGAGETVLPNGERVPKTEEGRVDVPDSLVAELRAVGYSDSPPQAEDAAAEPLESPDSGTFGRG